VLHENTFYSSCRRGRGSVRDPCAAALNVFACEPEWAALVQELGGDKVSVYTATTALQDPHRIEARPSLIARARGADLVVCTGAELEIGWLPLVQSQSGNAKIQTGQPDTSKQRAMSRCSKNRRVSIARWATCTLGATRTSISIRATSGRSRRH
jgi:hypothetical protein